MTGPQPGEDQTWRSSRITPYAGSLLPGPRCINPAARPAAPGEQPAAIHPMIGIARNNTGRGAFGRADFAAAGGHWRDDHRAVVVTILNRTQLAPPEWRTPNVRNAPGQVEPGMRAGGRLENFGGMIPAQQMEAATIMGLIPARRRSGPAMGKGVLDFQYAASAARPAGDGEDSRGRINFAGQTAIAVIHDHSFAPASGSEASASATAARSLTLSICGPGDGRRIFPQPITVGIFTTNTKPGVLLPMDATTPATSAIHASNTTGTLDRFGVLRARPQRQIPSASKRRPINGTGPNGRGRKNPTTKFGCWPLVSLRGHDRLDVDELADQGAIANRDHVRIQRFHDLDAQGLTLGDQGQHIATDNDFAAGVGFSFSAFFPDRKNLSPHTRLFRFLFAVAIGSDNISLGWRRRFNGCHGHNSSSKNLSLGKPLSRFFFAFATVSGNFSITPRPNLDRPQSDNSLLQNKLIWKPEFRTPKRLICANEKFTPKKGVFQNGGVIQTLFELRKELRPLTLRAKILAVLLRAKGDALSDPVAAW